MQQDADEWLCKGTSEEMSRLNLSSLGGKLQPVAEM